jgi:hypothetical protein
VIGSACFAGDDLGRQQPTRRRFAKQKSQSRRGCVALAMSERAARWRSALFRSLLGPGVRGLVQKTPGRGLRSNGAGLTVTRWWRCARTSVPSGAWRTSRRRALPVRTAGLCPCGRRLRTPWRRSGFSWSSIRSAGRLRWPGEHGRCEVPEPPAIRPAERHTLIDLAAACVACAAQLRGPRIALAELDARSGGTARSPNVSVRRRRAA